MTAKAEGVYGDRRKRVKLEVVDTGGAAGLMGLAAWAATRRTGERETDDRIERMRQEGNRIVHEEVAKRGGNASTR